MQRKPYRSKPEGVVIAKVGEEVISFPGMGALRRFLSRRPGLTVSAAKHVYRGVTEDITTRLALGGQYFPIDIDADAYVQESRNVVEIVGG